MRGFFSGYFFIMILLPLVAALFCSTSYGADHFVPPTEEEMQEAISLIETKNWWGDSLNIGRDTYNTKFHVMLDPTDGREVHKIDTVDPELDCEEVEGGFIDCPKCNPCEQGIVSYDSCGFMTGRTCIPVQIKQDVVAEFCKKEAKGQENGDENCGKMVEKVYDNPRTKKQCTNYECQPIKASECAEVFPEPTPISVLEEAGRPEVCEKYVTLKPEGKKCDVACPVIKGSYDIPETQCADWKVAQNDTVFVCRDDGDEDECGVAKCELDPHPVRSQSIPIDFGDEDEDEFFEEDGIVECLDSCKKPEAVGPLENGKCAKELRCVKNCPLSSLTCPQPRDPDCFTKPASFEPDECECPQLKCARVCPVQPTPETCPSGKKPGQSEVAEKCCDFNDVCICKYGQGENCCLGDACNPDPICNNEEDCCPKDENGCFIHGKLCNITAGPSPGVVTEKPECRECPTGFVPRPKPNPLCCAGPSCNKIDCQTLQQCCDENECCAIYSAEQKKYIYVGEKCPPKCDSQEKPSKESYIINQEDSSIKKCPEGKCCCTRGLDMVVEDCPPPPPPCVKEAPQCESNVFCRGEECCISNENESGRQQCPAGKCCCKEGSRLVVKDCVPDCDEKSIPTCESGKTCTDCCLKKDDSTIEKCPAGKCCCTDGLGNLKVEDCNPPPPCTNPAPTCDSGEPLCENCCTAKPDNSERQDCPVGKCCCTKGDVLEVRPCPPPCSCKGLEDVYSNTTCCWDITIGGEQCPKGKACCDDNGKLRIVGNHCCKGDGCCANKGGQRDCCNDASSCCGTGCFHRCKKEEKDGSGGHLDHYAKNVGGEGTCDCRESATEQKCEKLTDEAANKCHKLQEVICSDECTRSVCKEETCSNTLKAWVHRFRRR